MGCIGFHTKNIRSLSNPESQTLLTLKMVLKWSQQ